MCVSAWLTGGGCVRVRVSAAWLTGGVCVSVCVSSVVDGVCVSVCVSSVVDRKGVCAHVTRLHALCGNKLPPFYVPPGCSHWVRARGGGPGAQGRRVEAGASACVRCGDGTLLSSQDVWQPHHALTFLWGQGCLVWSSPSQLVEGLTGSPRRGPVSLLLPSGGCLRFRFLSHCGWQGLCGCWGLTIPRPQACPRL